MELGSDGTAVVLLLIPVFSISILRSAILHIYELGKSRKLQVQVGHLLVEIL